MRARDDGVRLTFLGAAREVTGSMLLLEVGDRRVVIDCGMFQGRRAESRQRNRHLPRVALDADAVILTHSHIDHSGSLPVLVRDGFDGVVHTTSATRDLCAYMLRDAARIQEADAEYLNRKHADDPSWEPIVPIYTEDDALAALDRFVAVPYHRRFEPVPGVSVTLLDAGHILGSAQVVIDVVDRGAPRRVVVSGDLGRPGLPIIRDPEMPPRPIDLLVMESTYGNRVHAPIAGMHDDLARVIGATIERGGKVVIPAFAVGRTQELLVALGELFRTGALPRIPVYIDSPLAIDVTTVFQLHPECFDAPTRRRLDEDGELFRFAGLHVTRTREESMAINAQGGPAVILAGSGMAEGGRVLHHLRNLVGDPRNTVLIVGFMAQHTLGRRLAERRPRVKIWGVERDLLAEVQVLDAFSAHADRDDLIAYATTAEPRRLILVHGEPEEQDPLVATLTGRGLRAHAAERGETVTLDGA